jgi:hypothetical protein
MVRFNFCQHFSKVSRELCGAVVAIIWTIRKCAGQYGTEFEVYALTIKVNVHCRECSALLL